MTATLTSCEIISTRKKELVHEEKLQKPSFNEVIDDLVGIFTSATDGLDPSEASVSFKDRALYLMENCIASNSNAYFWMLLALTSALATLFGVCWYLITFEADVEIHRPTIILAIFDAFVIIASGGMEQSIESFGACILYVLNLLAGLVIFAVLVGLITESFQEMIFSMQAGKTKVVEKKHTLILGWNESTVRLICQIAFLRRQERKQNETWTRRIFWWTQESPSTQVATSPVVIMCNTQTKEEMQEAIMSTFQERGIRKRGTRVGWDIMCRVGDPTSIVDLRRVGAKSATAILLDMTDADFAENQLHEGAMPNAATLRAMLALRYVLFSESDRKDVNWLDKRVVVQLGEPSKTISAATFTDPRGHAVVLLQDLSIFLNSLMFNCVDQPGLVLALSTLLSFEGIALQSRKVTDFSNGGKHLIGKTIGELAHVWDNGIVAGVIPDEYEYDCDTVDKDNGIAPAASRVIAASDTVIFVSETSMPALTQGLMKPLSAEALSSLKAEFAEASKSPFATVQLLVCGFRDIWHDPRRFAYRIRQTAMDLPVGSCIHFMCLEEHEVFEVIMEAIMELYDSFTRTPDNVWHFDGSVSLMHSCGDAGDFDQLEAVVTSNKHFNQAIILTTTAEKKLDPKMRDTRMMSIMLMLRYIQKESNLPFLHVIGEDSMDVTAQIALRPRAGSSVDKCDFVNVQALYARALCQALAYPKMQPAIAQLFAQEENSPNLFLRNVGLYVTFGKQISFFNLVQKVQEAEPSDICIGYRLANAKLCLVPKHTEILSFTAGDRLAIFSRASSSGPTDFVKKPASDAMPCRGVLLVADDLAGVSVVSAPPGVIE